MKKKLIIFDLSGTLVDGKILVEGAKEILEHFHANNCILAVATAISSTAAKKILELIMTETTISTAETVIIGDAITDIHAGVSAHINTVGIIGWADEIELKKAGANNVIDKISNLKETIVI